MLMGRSGQTAVGTLFYEKLRRASPRSVAQREGGCARGARGARARRGGARGAVGGELGAATYARRSSCALRARPRGGALSRFRIRFFKITQSQYLVSVLVGCFLLVETGIPLCNALRKSHYPPPLPHPQAPCPPPTPFTHCLLTDYWLLPTRIDAQRAQTRPRQSIRQRTTTRRVWSLGGVAMNYELHR